jgi:hypothetical protein
MISAISPRLTPNRQPQQSASPQSECGMIGPSSCSGFTGSIIAIQRTRDGRSSPLRAARGSGSQRSDKIGRSKMRTTRVTSNKSKYPPRISTGRRTRRDTQNLTHRKSDNSNPGAWIKAEILPARRSPGLGFGGTPMRGTYGSIDAAAISSGNAAINPVISMRSVRLMAIHDQWACGGHPQTGMHLTEIQTLAPFSNCPILWDASVSRGCLASNSPLFPPGGWSTWRESQSREQRPANPESSYCISAWPANSKPSIMDVCKGFPRAF